MTRAATLSMRRRTATSVARVKRYGRAERMSSIGAAGVSAASDGGTIGFVLTAAVYFWRFRAPGYAPPREPPRLVCPARGDCRRATDDRARRRARGHPHGVHGQERRLRADVPRLGDLRLRGGPSLRLYAAA